MNILIVSGFLGAGKTTFIKELIRRTGTNPVILENESPKVLAETESAIRNINPNAGIISSHYTRQSDEWWRSDLADNLYTISDSSQEINQCVFIGRDLDIPKICKRMECLFEEKSIPCPGICQQAKVRELFSPRPFVIGAFLGRDVRAYVSVFAWESPTLPAPVACMIAISLFTFQRTEYVI